MHRASRAFNGASELSAPVWERIRRDVATRMERWAAIGIPANLALAAACFAGARHLAPEATWPWVLLGGMTVATLFRAVSHWFWRRAWERSPSVWTAWFRASALAPAVAWSGACTYGILSSGMTVMLAATLMCVVGFVAATIHALRADLVSTRGYLVVATAPTVLAGLVDGSPPALVFVALAAIGVTFLFTVAGRAYEEHWRAVIDGALYRAGEQQRAQLATAVDQGADAIAITDARGHLEYANPAFQQLVRRSSDELVGRRPVDLIHAERGPDPDALAETLARGQGWSGEVVLRDEHDDRLHHDVAISPVRDDSGRVIHYAWVGRDLTQVRALEARLGFADRMSTVGTLAAGVAHEINNPASFIALNIQQLRAGREPDAGWDEVLKEIEEGTHRIQNTVRQLLVFARGERETQQVVDLCSVLDAAVTLTGHEIRYRAQLERSYGPEPLPVVGDEGQLVQVFVNLLINAAQALDERPGLAETVELRARRDPDGTVVAEVADTGPGLPEEDLQRVFEPFFTTKDVGTGTGLGLANCHAIVTTCGGRIRARNRDERGAVFEVQLLAAAQDDLARSATEDAGVQPDPTGVRERPEPMRVLVVDDEAALGRALRRSLSEHEVTVVSSGAQGIAEWDTGEYDVMLCDLMMPDVTGMDVYRVVEATERGRPDRILFMTGGAFTREAREFLEEVDNTCLTKPIDTKELRERIDAFREGRAEVRSGACGRG